MSVLPIALHAADVTVVVVGGGRVATRKAAAFLAAGARVRVVAPAISGELREKADVNDRLDLWTRAYGPGDLEGATLVVAATDDAGVNETVAADARAAGKLVNRADAAAGGNFSTMAVHRAGDLTVGVVAGVPGAATRVRDVIAQRFDQRYADAIEFLVTARAALLARGEPDGWRALADDVVAQDFCDLVEGGGFQERTTPWR
ncbi:MAG: precorrin-2 dehydrogenase/sirohydrochlorin ferrochelatase family protein [Gemmatimonadaceae bacterium]